MSDDTPTQRLPESPGEPAAEPAASGEPATERTGSRTLLSVLIGVAAALLVAIIVLVVVLLNGAASPAPGPSPTTTASATPTTSESPTPTPTATPTPTETQAPPPPPPPDTAPGFASFSQGQTVSCNTTNPPGYTPPRVSFSYTAKNASAVWFVLGDGDAADAGAFPMPLSGNQDDVYDGPLEYPCPQASQDYTLTVVGQNGQHVSRTFTVTNTGDTQ